MKKLSKILKTGKLLVLTLILTLIIISPLIPIVIPQEPESLGNITFQPNVIPFLELHLVEEFFRFKWDEVPWRHRATPSPTFRQLDVKLLIVYNTTKKGLKHFSLKDFWRDVLKGTGAKWKGVKNKVTDYLYEFGFNITNIPSVIANDVEYVFWKLEGSNFDISEIELEEIEMFEEDYNITRIHLPSNLVLSYEDLWKYNYTVRHVNQTHTIVEGIKGKTDWNLDPITFSGDIITVIGGTEESPNDFEDLWGTDKAGIFTLQDRDNANETDLNVKYYMEYPLRPADEKVLGGGTIGDLYINVTNWSPFISEAWLRTVGLDRQDTQILSTSYLSGNGIYNLAYFFKSVNYTEIIFWDGVSNGYTFDYEIVQGQWGVVWKTGDTQYTFDVRIVLGNGTVAGTTWFADSEKQITFSANAVTANYQRLIDAKAYTYIIFGILEDESAKTTSRGVDFIALDSYFGVYYVYSGGYWTGYQYLYSCSFDSPNEQHVIGGYMTFRIWNSLFKRRGNIIQPGTVYQGDIYNVNMQSHANSAFSYMRNAIMDKIFVTDYDYILFTHMALDFSIKNLYARRITHVVRLYTNWIGTGYIINGDIDTWAFYFQSAGCTGEIYRQYEFDLTMYFQNGTQAQNANVTISNDYLGTSTSWLTFANGSIPQQTYSYGHYNQTGGNTIYDYNPYNLTVTLDGYETYTDQINITQKEDLRIALTPTTGKSWAFSFFVIAFMIFLICAGIIIVAVKK